MIKIPVLSKKIYHTTDKKIIEFFLVQYSSDCPICLNFQDTPVILSECDHVFCTECLILNEEFTLLKNNNQNMKTDDILPIFAHITRKVQDSGKTMIEKLKQKMEFARLNIKMKCPVCSSRYFNIFNVKFIFLDIATELVGKRMIFRRLQDDFELTTSFEDFGSFPYNSMYHIQEVEDEKTNHQVKEMVKSELIERRGISDIFKVYKLEQSLDNVFYQNVDGALIFIGINYLDSLKKDHCFKKRPFIRNEKSAILPLFLSIVIKSMFKMKNMGRISHLDWDTEIIIVEGDI